MRDRPDHPEAGREATTNAPNWSATSPPAAPATGADQRADRNQPEAPASSVIISATPSTTATISQTIQCPLTAPVKCYRAAYFDTNPAWCRSHLSLSADRPGASHLRQNGQRWSAFRPRGSVMSGAIQLSYSHGTVRHRRCSARRSARTCGGSPPRTRRAEALVDVPTGRRWTYARARRRHRHARPRADRGRARGRRPGRHLGAELRRVGAAAVRDRQGRHRSWSTSTRPTAATSSATCCASPGSGCWSARRASRPATTGRWSTRCAADLPELRASDLPRHAGLGRRCAGRPRPRTAAGRRPIRWRARGRAWPSTTRSTSSTRAGRPGSPRARRCRTTTS